MSTMELIEKEVIALPEPLQHEVFDFARFLRSKNAEDSFNGLLLTRTPKMVWLERSQVLVGQTFLSAGSRNFPVPCRATGKSPAPAGWKACPTLPTPSQLWSSG
jgi:hypothetical protein